MSVATSNLFGSPIIPEASLFYTDLDVLDQYGQELYLPVHAHITERPKLNVLQNCEADAWLSLTAVWNILNGF